MNVCDYFQIESLLNKGGGKRDHYLSQMVTHAIAEDVTEDDYSEAKELFELPVVTVNTIFFCISFYKFLNY